MKISFVLFLALLTSCSYIPEKYRPEAEAKPSEVFSVSWLKNLDPAHDTGNLPIALHSPVIQENIVYSGSDSGEMNAYQLEDGRRIWSESDKGGYHAAPVVYKDTLIYGTDQGRVFSRDLVSGKLKYSIDLDAAIEAKPVIYKDRAIFHTRNHKIFCLDATTGKMLWSYRRAVPYLTTIQRASRPAVDSNKIYVGFADGNLAAFSLDDGSLIWEKKLSTGSKFVDVDVTPVFFNGKLISGALGGDVAVVDPATGVILRRINYTIGRRPFILGDKVIFGTVDGKVVQFNSNLFEENKVDLSSHSVTGVTSWKGNIVVTTSGSKIHLLNSSSLKEMGQFDLGSVHSGVFGDISVSEDKMAILSSRSRLYLFK